ncbi:MAG: penicillin-binding transpeptidase domain-containing protein [Planctomycetota bacterium]|nr:penicillin-binding transpeptidase domain-containing protein [Planctomycetota bacterium]
MVSARRIGLPLVAFGFALCVVVARLYDVMVLENDVWAREAANLMRSWRVEPYLRGTIYDREGRVWVRDEQVYELEFVWRDFRRGHPLGQVAQMRSLVDLDSVSLEEVHRELVPTALAFANLSPAEIDAFGDGEALTYGDVTVPAVNGDSGRARRRNAKTVRRGTRAAELHWYVLALLAPSRQEEHTLREAKGTARWNESYLSLLARARKVPMSAVESALERRLQDSLLRLSELAHEVDLDELLGEGQARGRSPFEGLLIGLEEKRREVEFSAADDLFHEAAGFAAQRLDGANLTKIDLEWLRRAMYWDRDRLAEWCRDRGDAWPAAIKDALAGHAIARAKVEPDWAPPVDRILSSLACLFASDERTQKGSPAPVPWWELDDVVVLADFARRFERTSTIPESLFTGALPFQDAALREGRARMDATALIEAVCPGPEDLPAVPAKYERRHGTREEHTRVMLLQVAEQVELPTWQSEHEDPVEAVLLDWDRRLQRRVHTLFSQYPESVSLRESFVKEALETRPYVVRDRESRPLRFTRRPSYGLVHLVTRHPELYAGFLVLRSTRRVPVALVDPDADDPKLVAEFLIGRTRSPYLVDIFAQRPDEQRVREEQRRLQRDSESVEWIQEAVAGFYAPGVAMGGSGLEGYFDAELKGTNGYRETLGLREREEGREPVYVPAVHGGDLTLTLDLELQRVVEEILENPAPPPPSEDKPDLMWHEYPVGAAVLMTVDGELLVAASTPRTADQQGHKWQDGERGVAIDRTLRRPRFQPPGSVIKPLVAAWALEQGIINENTLFQCTRWEDGYEASYASHKPGPRTGKVHCLSQWGHSGQTGQDGVALDFALCKSCNAYFAALGEQIDQQGHIDLARTFGLDLPTGVRRDFHPGRLGLVENSWAGEIYHGATVQTAKTRQRLANGLTAVQATPVQMARAYAGLATGFLPEVTLVRYLADEQVPPNPVRLPISDAHLETVRRALLQVANGDGTAKDKGLSEADLGYVLACKTGSADYLAKQKVPVDPTAPLDQWEAEEGERKHAWLAGYFPAEDPKVVIVIYCHDTSSHIATHMAAQILTNPVVDDWVKRKVLR